MHTHNYSEELEVAIKPKQNHAIRTSIADNEKIYIYMASLPFKPPGPVMQLGTDPVAVPRGTLGTDMAQDLSKMHIVGVL